MRLVELLTDRAMRKIVHCYCRDCIRPDDPQSLAELIIKFRDHRNWIFTTDTANYNRVMDQWCYECEKYKGSCLGHVYPEPDVQGCRPAADALARIDVLEERLIALEEALVEIMRGR